MMWNDEWTDELEKAGELIIEIAKGMREMESRAFRAGYEYGAMDGGVSFPSVHYDRWVKSRRTDA